MLGLIPKDRLPAVGVHNDDVGIWSMAGGEPHGLIMSPLAAMQTGFKLIALGGEMSPDGGCEIDPTAIAFDAAEEPSEECAARMVVTIEGAQIAIVFDAQKLVEVTAAMVKLTKTTT